MSQSTCPRHVLNIGILSILLSSLAAVETAPRPTTADYLPPAVADAPAMARKIRVIYHIPSDRTPTANYQAKFETLCAYLADIFKRDLVAKGLRCDGPAFVWDSVNNRLKIHIVNGSLPADQYGGSNRGGAGPWSLIGADVDASIGTYNTNFDLVLSENWDQTGSAATFWNGDFALGAYWTADGGRGMFSAWILQDALCATSISGQIAKLKDATPLTGRSTFTQPNAPVYEFIEDGLGAMVHEMGHALGLPHDRRANDSCIMGNGFRSLRTNFVAGATGPLALFSDDSARSLSSSRILTGAADLGDTAQPSLLIQAPLRAVAGTASIPVQVHAWDDRALHSALIFTDLGDTVVGGGQMQGLATTLATDCAMLTPFTTSAQIVRVFVRDQGGARSELTVPINNGKGADFWLTSLGGPAPFTVTADAARTATLGGTPTSYAWNFGDGTTATGIAPVKTWNVAGTYTVTLTVTYADATTATGTRQVRVSAAAANQAPTLAAPPAGRTLADAAYGPVAFSVWDDLTAAGALTVTATSSNPAVVRSSDLILGGSGGQRNLTILPAGAGSTVLTLTVTDGGGLSRSASMPFTVEAASLPAGWRTANLGAGSDPSGASLAGATWTITAGGYGVGTGSGDDVRFTWQAVTGDTTIIAKVGSLSPATTANAGIAIRTGTSATSATAAILCEGTAGNWNRMVSRLTDQGSMSNSWGTTRGAPAWMRLVRTGNTITGSTSADGVTWDAPYNAGWTVTLPAATIVYVGLVVSSGQGAPIATALFDQVSITGAASQLAWSQQPAATQAGVAVSPAPSIQVRNAANTLLTQANARVTLAFGANPGGATMSGTTTAIAVNGVATFPDLRISAPGIGYTLVASATGLPNATSAAFDVGNANQAPIIITPASANPAVIPLSSTMLSVGAGDDGALASLTYTWSTIGTPPAPVSFSVNGTNAASSTTASFTAAGTYQFQVAVRDAAGATTISSATAVVAQTLTAIVVTPGATNLTQGATQTFAGSAKDQFSAVMTAQPSLTWSLTAGSPGSITSNGIYTASAVGTAGIRATSGTVVGTATAIVSAPLSICVNFQPASAPAYAGHLIDSGAKYALQNGQTYGWNASLKGTALVDRNNAASPDQRYDTFATVANGTTPKWEIAVANGTYDVLAVCGDASAFASTRYHLTVEGTTILDGVPTSAARWVSGSLRVVVSDGQLTLANGANANGNKVDFVTITAVPTGNG